jgi:hypothetical protein
MKESMEYQMGIGNEIIEQVWERLRPYELPKLRSLPADRITVVKGSYDHIEQILKNAKIPHTTVNSFPYNAKQQDYFKNCKILFVNCDSSYHNGTGGLEEKGITSENKTFLTEFVDNRGRMITTDWAQAVVRYLFDNKITVETSYLPESVVKVKFPTKIGQELLGINYEGAQPKWWIESSSDRVTPCDNSGIIELITSDELRSKSDKPISLGFKYGNGEVFHFVSHLIAQKFEPRDSRDAKSLENFLDLTNTRVKEGTATKCISLGGIETTYTLMNTVLELAREGSILDKFKGKRRSASKTGGN